MDCEIRWLGFEGILRILLIKRWMKFFDEILGVRIVWKLSFKFFMNFFSLIKNILLGFVANGNKKIWAETRLVYRNTANEKNFELFYVFKVVSEFFVFLLNFAQILKADFFFQKKNFKSYDFLEYFLYFPQPLSPLTTDNKRWRKGSTHDIWKLMRKIH
jgi:hypothetical protein